MVEHLPHHPEVQGSSPTDAGITERDIIICDSSIRLASKPCHQILDQGGSD